MADTDSMPSPQTALIYFFVITLLYFIFKYKAGDNKQQKMIWGGIYVCLLVVGEYMINLSLTSAICGESQWGLAMTVTLIPWILIFGILNLLLMLFPGWLSPFSNTLGYLVAKLSGLAGTLDQILLPEVTKEYKKTNPGMAEALEHIYSDKSLLINEVNSSNFDAFWSRMTNAGLFKPSAGGPDGTLGKKLANLVRLKEIVAEFIWYMLTGGLVTSVGYNYIVTSGCTRSLADMQKRHAEYEEEQVKITEEREHAPEQKIYSTLE